MPARETLLQFSKTRVGENKKEVRKMEIIRTLIHCPKKKCLWNIRNGYCIRREITLEPADTYFNSNAFNCMAYEPKPKG